MTISSSYSPAIISLRTLEVTSEIESLLACYKPIGIIIMPYNIKNKEQLKSLCKKLRQFVPFLLIDQEGGQVRRLKPPEFYDAKSMHYFGQLYTLNPTETIEALILQTKKGCSGFTLLPYKRKLRTMS